MGLYLGDGHISPLARTQRLRIFLDSRHANVVAATEELLTICYDHVRSLGLSPRRYARYVRLYRRNDVELLLTHVGVKERGATRYILRVDPRLWRNW